MPLTAAAKIWPYTPVGALVDDARDSRIIYVRDGDDRAFAREHVRGRPHAGPALRGCPDRQAGQDDRDVNRAQELEKPLGPCKGTVLLHARGQHSQPQPHCIVL